MVDYISREAAIDALAMADAKKGWKSLKFSEMQKCLLGLPSVHPELPESWWKTDHGYMWLCPHCGLPVHSDFEECLRCGATKRQSAEHTMEEFMHSQDEDGSL